MFVLSFKSETWVLSATHRLGMVNSSARYFDNLTINLRDMARTREPYLAHLSFAQSELL